MMNRLYLLLVLRLIASNNGEVIQGKATCYYDDPKTDACGNNGLPQVTFPKGFSTALGIEDFDNGYSCGACYEATCVGPYAETNKDCLCGDSDANKVIVQVTDRCHNCPKAHLDMNSEAFVSIVSGSDPSSDCNTGMANTCGALEIQYRRVSCDFDSNIKIRSKTGTSGWWYGLHIDDVAGYGAIQEIKLREAANRKDSESFDIICDKSGGPSYWICHEYSKTNRVLSAPLDVYIMDSSGRVLTQNDVITILDGDQEFDFGTNFDPISDEKECEENLNTKFIFKYKKKKKAALKNCGWLKKQKKNKKKKICKKKRSPSDEHDVARNKCPVTCGSC